MTETLQERHKREADAAFNNARRELHKAKSRILWNGPSTEEAEELIREADRRIYKAMALCL